MGNVIVLNRMYAGSYLDSHLGHEVINLLQADNGCFYLYLNPYGNLTNRSTEGGIMLLTKKVNRYCHEVIGMATGLKIADGVVGTVHHTTQLKSEQATYIKNQPQGDIRYGGVSIIDLFNSNDQQEILVTYKADKVVRPKGNGRIFIQYKDCPQNKKISTSDIDSSDILVDLSEFNASASSLRSFIDDEKYAGDYQTIYDQIINNDAMWESQSVPKLNLNVSNKCPGVSLFDICRIQNDENCISNAMAWFMAQPQYQNLWKGFFDYINNTPISWSGNLKVEREVKTGNNGRIDILIKDDNNVLVIENKIKSDIIVSPQSKISQLTRYYNYISSNSDFRGLNKFFILLTPEYSMVRLQGCDKKNWIHVTYKQMYDYLSMNQSVFSGDANFEAFYDVLLRHTYAAEGDFLYQEMEERLIKRINEIKNFRQKPQLQSR